MFSPRDRFSRETSTSRNPSESHFEDDYASEAIIQPTSPLTRRLPPLNNDGLSRRSIASLEIPVDIPKCFTCPITQKLMQDPVILIESAMTFEQRALTQWLEKGNRTCPVTGIPLFHCTVVQNVSLKEAIALWSQEHGVPLLPEPAAVTEYDFVVSLLEEQLKATYRGWETTESSPSPDETEDEMLEHLTRLLSSSDRSTHQSAALNLARACWGCHRSQSIVGDSQKSIEGTLPRLVILLNAELTDRKPGHVGWALAEVIRYHPKNQMRLFRLRDIDLLGVLLRMIRSNDDQWVARGARVVGAWASGNPTIQNLMLEFGVTSMLVDCLRGASSIQQLHAGMALMHITYENHLTSMQVLKDGALMAVPSLLNSRALIVRVVGAGIITHLLGMFDYSWGTNEAILASLVDLMNQCEDYAGIVAASAIFELTHRDKVDLYRISSLPVLPRMTDLLISCSFLGFRRRAHHFFLQWANSTAATNNIRKAAGKACRETLKQLIEATSMHISGVNEITIGVVYTLLPLGHHYKLVIEAMTQFERLSMDATIGDGGRAMCREIVAHSRKMEMEAKTRRQMIWTTVGICSILKFIQFFR